MAVVVAACSAGAIGQQVTPALQPAGQAPGQPAQPRQTPPQLILGQRVLSVQQSVEINDTVVIVTDTSSYIQAISRWQTHRRFPVLIDDGSPLAHEDIARFIRGFHPAHIVRWSANDPKPAPWASADRDVLQSAVAKVWAVPGDKPTQGELLDLWKKVGFQPVGLVVTQEGDAAWPAALALAAGRGEPITFINVTQTVNGTLTPAQADDYEQAIETAAQVSGFTWRDLGDALDAVTLCCHAPAKIDKGKGETLALTDRIGRISKGLENGHRWAWCGQIFGNAEQSCYRAMCALFMTTKRAWVFDGYPDKKPWSDFDGSKAADMLRQVGITVELDDTPRQGAADWRLRAARTVTADLILVNTMGNCDFFDLTPGQCKPGDVPILNVPAALHIVHSWSLQFPQDRSTLGGRWLERGVFAYAGSVNEPFLEAFVPTPAIAARLIAGAPFGSAVRIDGGQLWKIAVLGDPLYTLGQEPKRIDLAPVEGGVDVGEGLRALLTGSKFVEALDILTLTGRDVDAATLMKSLLAQPGVVTPDIAQAGLMALMRAGENKAVVEAYAKLDAKRGADPALRDALWLASYPLMSGADDTLLRVLRANVRPDQIGRDATTLATAWAAKHGREQADAMLRDLKAGITDGGQREALEKAMREAPEKWGP